MLKVKNGETDKLGLLYERHKRKLFGFFYNQNHDAALSEDLVQNVFVRIIKYKHTYTGEGSFLAWMFSTARNVNYDHFKKNKNALKENVFTNHEYKIENGEDVEGEINRKEELVQLHKAMAKLDVEKREVLVLSKLKELKFSQIGEVLGCSEGTAKVKAHRALKELRTVYMKMEMQ